MLDHLVNRGVEVPADPLEQDLDDAAHQEARGEHRVEPERDAVAPGQRQRAVRGELGQRLPRFAAQPFQALAHADDFDRDDPRLAPVLGDRRPRGPQARPRNEGLCLLEGYYTPFGGATLQSLYPTHAAYVSQFTAAANAELAAGFLTRYDYNQAVKSAQAAPVP